MRARGTSGPGPELACCCSHARPIGQSVSAKAEVSGMGMCPPPLEGSLGKGREKGMILDK